ncbi:hypothetical protein [Corynebacterium sp. H130]|uniref:hypothetical protein n=1 Tax=Corynebacterium sp. H130 TaxID=3133444 RepID=UPI0030962024
MGFLEKLGFGKKSQPEAPANDSPAAGIDQLAMMQNHVNPGVLAVVNGTMQDDNDHVSGTIRLDQNMRVMGIEGLTRNGAPIAVTPNVIEEANNHFAPLSQLPEQMRFHGIEFECNAGAIDMRMIYPD